MTSTTKTNAMKNYIPRRTYRERGQLTHRKNLGILEKKKDYLKRSRDFKNKDATIKKLSIKAQMRNPDEHYHKMKKMRKDDRTGEALFMGANTPAEKENQMKQRKMFENQNIALVNMKRTIESKKAEKLMKNLHHIDFNDETSSRVQFVSSFDEIKEMKVKTNFTENELDQDINLL